MSDPGAIRPQPSRVYRWVVLIFISLAMFGNYYPYDSIAPIADLLKSQLAFSDDDIGKLYSYYSVAALIVLLLGGYMIDRLGTRKSTFIFAVICLAAGITTALSPNLNVMIAGRVLLGIGSEPLIVAITTAIAKWFKGKELSFAFGVNLTIARLGSVAADNSPTLAKPLYVDWQSPLWLAAGISALCVVGASVYWILESRAEKRYDLGGAGQTERLVLKDLYRFDRSYWYVVALCLTFYSAIFPFRAFAIKFFMEAHGASRETAGFLNSVLPISAMIATPLFGLVADRIGKRALLMAFGSLLITPVYLMLAYTQVPLFVPTIMMGIAFSLIPAVMWPSVAYLVDQRRLGSAYALMTLIQQIGMAAMPRIIGTLNDRYGASVANPAGYNPGMWAFSVLGIVGLFFSFMLWRTERGPRAHGLETIRAKD